MSDDIVTRLRYPNWMHPPRGLFLEAAAEIECLRAQLATADRRVADMREAAARMCDRMVETHPRKPYQEAAEWLAERIRALSVPDAPPSPSARTAQDDAGEVV